MDEMNTFKKLYEEVSGDVLWERPACEGDPIEEVSSINRFHSNKCNWFLLIVVGICLYGIKVKICVSNDIFVLTELCDDLILCLCKFLLVVFF